MKVRYLFPSCLLRETLILYPPPPFPLPGPLINCSVLLQGLFVPKETPETPKKAAGPGKRRTNNETVTSKFKAQVRSKMY